MSARVLDAYPLTALQAGMVFHSEFDRGLTTYRDVCSALVRTAFDPDALRGALAHAVRCHDVLRTAFDLHGFDEPVQLVHAHAEVQLEVHDLRGLDPARQDAFVSRHARLAGEMAFSWSQPPLLRASAQVLSGTSFRITLCFHHAILDGWSAATLLAEITRSYAANLGIGGVPMPEPPDVAFRAYVAEEQAALACEDTFRYWNEYARRCDGAGPLWHAPSAKPLEVVTVPVVPADLRALIAAGERLRVPLKSIFLAIHVRALALLTGRGSVCTGVIANTRLERVGGDRVLGLFINTLPLCVELAGLGWGQLAQRVFQEESDGMPHRRYPLTAIQRAAGGRPLFSAVFDYQQYHQWSTAIADTGLEVEDVRFFERTNYPLLVSASRNPSGTEARILVKHHPDVIAAGDINRFSELLREAVREFAGTGIESSGTVVAPVESHHPPNEGPVHEMFARAARQHPSAAALRTAGEAWTYRRLDRCANQLARRLLARGLGGGQLVALVIDRGLELVALQLAAWKAGAALLFLDPADPPQRNAAILEDSRPSLVIDGLAGVRQLFEGLDAEPDAPLDRVAESSAPAYVLYTSGSTGEPKGVVVPHRALSNLLRTLADDLGIGPGDVLVAVTTPAFDISLLELWLPLVTGAAVRLASRVEAADPRRIAAVLDESEASFMQATPWHWRLLVDSGWAGRDGLNILCGGDTLPEGLAESLLARGKCVWNLYGPTEATIWCSARRIDPSHGRIDIGRPLRGLRMSVRDAGGAPLAQGIAGELWVGGTGVACGYLNRPRETAARFIAEGADRFYRTGDLAQGLPDGSFQLLGRMDDQVKVRGFRIELGEVVAALLAQPGVRDAHVAAASDDGRLVAYLVLANEAALRGLRAAMDTALPRYMLPSSYVLLESLPRLPNGKIDRRALTAVQPRSTPAAPAALPRNALEKLVLSIWEEVLRRPGIGIDEALFDAGGDSIGALRIAARIEKATGRWVPLSDIVGRATVAGIAARLGELRCEPQGCAVRMTALGRDDREPLFLVHPLGGHVFSFRHLADAFGTARAVYGLRARGLESGEQPLRDIREMARLYVDAIRSVQPTGPYAIAGWCMGGIISFEIARQMLDVGQQVRFLGVLSTPVLPVLPEGVALKKHVLAQHIELDIDQLEGLSEDDQIGRIIELARAKGPLRPDLTDVELARRLVTVYEAHASALRSYRPAPYRGSVVYFSPVGSGAVGDQHVDAWRSLVSGEFRVERIAGDPYSFIVDGNAKQLASRMTQYLAA